MHFALLAAITRDARFALMALRRDRLFVAAASGSLALALGVVTSVYGVIDAATHPVSALKDPERVVYVGNQGSGASRAYTPTAFATLVREKQRVFEQTAVIDGRSATYTVGSHVDHGYVLRISDDFFAATGIAPVLGRALGRTDFAQGSAPVALIGFRTWRRTLGAQRDAIGRSIDVEGRVYSIIGVMPPDATGRLTGDVVLPAVPGERLAAPMVIGRIAAAIVPDSARDQLRRDIDPLLTATYGVGRRPFRTFFRPAAALPASMNDLHKTLLAASVLIVLIASANLASLMLARGIRRSREYALRFALGARRMSVVRQTLVEALVCALLAAGLGTVIAMWLFEFLTYGLTTDVPQLGVVAVSLNWRVFVFAGAAAVATALLFGTFPAFRASSVKIEQRLRDGAGTVTRRSHGRYSPLVIAQVALTLALLMGANLLVQSAREMRDRENGGVAARGLFVVNAFVPRALRDSIDAQRMRESLLGAVEREEGVRALATVRHATPAGQSITVTLPHGGNRRGYLTSYAHVSANYLSTLGVRIADGRGFLPGDEVSSVGAAVVSRAAARWFWRGENPVGQMVTLADIGRDGPLVRVVGVAEDIRPPVAATPDAEPIPAVYVVARDSSYRLETILVRGASGERTLQTRLARRARDAIPPGAVVRITPYLATFDAEVALRHFIAGVFIALGALALGLAMFGVFSVRAHDVAQRTREFAVRMSIGATRENIIRSVLRDSVVIVLAGTGIGAFLAMYAGRQLDPWLYGVFYTDVRALIRCRASADDVGSRCVAGARTARSSQQPGGDPARQLNAAWTLRNYDKTRTRSWPSAARAS